MHRASASAMVVNRATFQQAGGWTKGLFHLDDLDMMMKLIESIRKVRNVHGSTSNDGTVSHAVGTSESSII